MQTLVVDANFLMSAYRFKVDAIQELGRLVAGGYVLVTSSAVINELQGLCRETNAASRGARYALDMMRKQGVRVIRTSQKADAWIEEYCSKNGATACTNDAELRKRLKKRGVRTVVLKGRSHLGYA